MLSEGSFIVNLRASAIEDKGDDPSGIIIGCYPNPAYSEVTFNIEAARLLDNVSLTISDISGKTVASGRG